VKALFLTNEYPPNVYGGAGVHVDYLTRELARHIEVEVRCFGEQRGETARLRVRGYGAARIEFNGIDARLRSPLDAFGRCLGFAATPVTADVVHCHTWYSHLGGIAVKLAYGVPLVITVHSLEPGRPWKREQLGRGYELSSWIERTALGMADTIIAVSEETRQDILRLFDVKPERVLVVHNGIDTGEYRPVSSRNALRAYGVDPGRPYVLFVGRVTRQKGILHLVRAIRHLDPSTQVVLCAGAPDTEEIAREMAAEVARARAGREGVVWIPEMIDRAAVIELYSHAAVFCCPSIYEPFGIINLEAMACATPVVASAVGGIKEVVVPDETGLLVELRQRPGGEPADPERFEQDLASAINRLMGDEPLRRRMGEAGRARAIGSFSWAAIAGRVIDVYGELIEKSACSDDQRSRASRHGAAGSGKSSAGVTSNKAARR
jgi:starch synthase